MPCRCDPGERDGYAYVQWIGTYFYDCVYTPAEIVAFASGLLSILLYLVSMMPQWWKNYQRKCVDGLSLTFLGAWVIGDMANLCGALFTQQFPTVQYTGMYFVASDMVTIAQYLYYARVRPWWIARNHGGVFLADGDHGGVGGGRSGGSAALKLSVGDEETPLLVADGLANKSSKSHVSANGDAAVSTGVNDSEGGDSDFLPHRGRGHTLASDYHREQRTYSGSTAQSIHLYGGVKPATLMAVLAVLSVSVFTASADSVAAPIRALINKAIGADDDDSDEPLCDFLPELGEQARWVGVAMAWASGLLYFCSRIPQILVNYRTKAVDGLSLTLFILTISANITYGLAIIIRFPPIDTKFYLSILPFLLGSVGTLIFDVIIVTQAFQYGSHDAMAPTSRLKQALRRLFHAA